MTRVSIVTLGCPKNVVDSGNLADGLSREGIICTEDMNDSDIVLVNTCGFIEDAKKESIEEILKLRQLRSEGRKLLVFGCLAKRYKDELIKEIPDIDAIWGVGEEEKIIEYCKSVDSGNRGQVAKRTKKTQDSCHPELIAPSYAYLKIAEGCDRGCTFCVIPSIRGSYMSFEPETILKYAERHIRAGIKELIIIAQDIGNYGNNKGYNLSSLLRDISSISGDFWIRLLYLYPTALGKDLISAIAGNGKVCNYIDVPLQHSEDKILKAMGRGGSREAYKNKIRMIRDMIPDITLRTTFITGFPGETEDDFNGLKIFVEEMRFDRLGVFEYSKEEGTPASKMKGIVPKRIAKMRRDELMRIQSHISLEKNRLIIGKRFKALIDEVDGDIAVARLYSQAPEIDGVTLIPGCGMHHPPLLSVGGFVDIEITDAYDYDLKGRAV
ncbi:MAG: 30S ribosomal protein S12 methylthiotransferase RimO [Nitrospirota bacterium]